MELFSMKETFGNVYAGHLRKLDETITSMRESGDTDIWRLGIYERTYKSVNRSVTLNFFKDPVEDRSILVRVRDETLYGVTDYIRRII